MPERFYRHTQQGSIHVVELILPIQVDATDFDRVNEAVGDLAEGVPAGEQWVIDLRQVEYVGSALLGLLVNLRQRIKVAGGKLVLCELNDHVSKALKTCSLHNLFAVVDKRDAAMRRAVSSS